MKLFGSGTIYLGLLFGIFYYFGSVTDCMKFFSKVMNICLIIIDFLRFKFGSRKNDLKCFS